MLGVTTNEFPKIEFATLHYLRGDDLTSEAIETVCMSHDLGLALISISIEDSQVWKIDSSVRFLGIVIGEETSVGKGPSEDVVNY